MAKDDYDEENELTDLEKFSSAVNYDFHYQPYDIDTFDKQKNERDHVLASELKKYYPELALWPARALATAWRLYSKDVGLIEEELVCVRSPNLLAYLFVRQEKWPVSEDDWLNALNAASRILWPASDLETQD